MFQTLRINRTIWMISGGVSTFLTYYTRYRMLVVDSVIPFVTFEKRKVYCSKNYSDAVTDCLRHKTESTTHCRQWLYEYNDHTSVDVGFRQPVLNTFKEHSNNVLLATERRLYCHIVSISRAERCRIGNVWWTTSPARPVLQCVDVTRRTARLHPTTRRS